MIDSEKNEDDIKDEGDMFVQEDGTILERGESIDPETGARQEYEELWQDLDIEPIGSKGKRRNSSEDD